MVEEMNVFRALEALVRECGTKKAAANALGISPSYFGDIYQGRRSVTDPLLKKLGLRRRVVVERVKKIS